MDDIYREHILEHAKNQRNRGILHPADIDHEASNPLCGDYLRLTLRVNPEQTITEIGWDGEGCAISQATASLLGEHILGKSLDDIKDISRDDILEMIGIPLTMNRMKCALLSFKVLCEGVYGSEYWQQKNEAGA